MIKFFDPSEEQRIITAIQAAERETSGEIRVHLEKNPQQSALEEALRLFPKLGMHQTKDRNGVLILLAPENRQFAILGDEGINKVVSEDFWDEERDLMQAYFRRQEFAEGLVLVIQQIGAKLKQHFPYQSDDENELPDEISYGGGE